MNKRLLVIAVLSLSMGWISASLWDGKQSSTTERLAKMTASLEKFFTNEGNKLEQARRMAILFRQLVSDAFLKLQEETFKEMYTTSRTRGQAGQLPTKIAAIEGLILLLETPDKISSTLLGAQEEMKKLTDHDYFALHQKDWHFNPRLPILYATRSGPVLKFIKAIQEIAKTQFKEPTGQEAVRFYNIVKSLVTDLLADYENELKDDLLFMSAVMNFTEKTKKYLKTGANPNYIPRRGTNNDTPLFQAIINDNLEIVALLLEAGADPNILSETLLSVANQMVRNKKVSTAIVEILKKHGALGGGFTPLTDYANRNNLAGVKLILDGGKNPNEVAPNGFKALYWAKKRGNTEMIELLKKYGATE